MFVVAQVISQNQQAFIRLLNEPVPPTSQGGAPGGGAAGAGQGAGGPPVPGQGMPGAPGQGGPYTTIQVTAEEKEAIERVSWWVATKPCRTPKNSPNSLS